MKLLMTFMVVYGILLNGTAYGQKDGIKALSVGDHVPDIVFENVLNYKSKKVKLSDFKGKLVILDMWSVYCSSCIDAFPKMEALQKTFDKQVQILLVNPHDPKYDPQEKIVATLEKFKSRTGFYPSLPIPIHDAVLNNYFPHQSVPHYVWIDGNRTVVAITDIYEVTSLNIKKLLEGSSTGMPINNEQVFDKTKPLLVGYNGGDDGGFIYRAMFSSYIGGIGTRSGVRLNEKKEIIGAFRINQPLRVLINEAYYDIINGLPENRVILKVKNPDKYGFRYGSAYSYCYDLSIAPTAVASFNFGDHLKNDLKRYFNVSASKEKRTLLCYVLNNKSNITGSLTKFNKQMLDLEDNSIKKYIHSYSVAEVLSFMDRLNKPLIDETGVSGQKIDVDFPDHFDMKNEKAVIEVLKKAGFEIKEEEREIEVVVITDK
ncbi:thiol-disulfide isomerase/thioredoxin [Pedobacter sp. AK017]|uniref:TlpA family protein disulfide reductase n=1 Tax=Pedobacter sp. AK017 TaxID=2723073 RepID=UPI00161D00E7|nr:redoxin domain-containing protein [Pedobacter sp. AK017]MBB5441314.1 thiol-disulfide isomerase/thioredoxin [Pedobacter sp. AK017]